MLKLTKCYKIEKYVWGVRAVTPSGARVLATIRKVDKKSWLVSGYKDAWHANCLTETEAIFTMQFKLRAEGYYLA